MTGSLREIWLTASASAPMRRVPNALLLAGAGLDGDRYALGVGTWSHYRHPGKHVTLIDVDGVADVARETGADLSPGDTRRNLVTSGLELPALVGGWLAVGATLLFGVQECPPCTHLERLTGVRLIRAMAHRGGINAAVVAGGPIAEGDAVRAVPEEEAVARGAMSRPV